jgi:hypothetical protein
MSWLFGIFNKENAVKSNINLDEEFDKYESNNIFLAVGGNPDTAFLTISGNIVFASVGVLIGEENSRKKIIRKKNLTGEFHILPNNLNGHFVLVTYSNGKLDISNDAPGLRELYFIEKQNQLIFSTRIDLLADYANDKSINFKTFSSLWLTNFQLSNNSIFNEIKRLGPGGKIEANQNEILVSNQQYIKTSTAESVNSFPESLFAYCSIKPNDNKVISLGLSGGIDSRLVLAFLLKSKQSFQCYSLRNEENNDLKIAGEICKSFKLEHHLVDRENINLQDAEEEIHKYYKNIPPSIPLTQLLDFGFYGKEYLVNVLLLDGGFGGFYRRQHFNKLYIKRYSFFKLENAGEIKSLLSAPKPDIYNEEVLRVMQRGVEEVSTDLISLFDSPKSKKDLADILDLISVRFMLPNIFGPGQTILDQNFISFMPLAQKEIINIGLNIPQQLKTGGKFIKGIIKETEKKLTGINLVSSNLEYNFYLNYKLAMIKLLVHRKLIKQHNYKRYNVFLNSREYIFDLLNSNTIKNNQYLAHSKISKIVSEFFKGDYSKGSYLDWFLTFSLWAQANKLF